MGMWRMADPVISDEGAVMKGGMWPSQRKAWESLKYVVAFLGGYGCGKSKLVAKFSIGMALHNSPVPFMACSPSYKMAKRTIIPAIKELLSGRNISWKYNNTDHEFTFSDHGRTGVIWIGSGQDADSLKGSNLCGFAMDEFCLQDKTVFDQLLARVRDPMAKLRRILLAGTPEGVIGWSFDMCSKNGKDSHKYDLEVVRANTRENKALPLEFIETLIEAYDDKMQKAYLAGEFVNLSTGLLYYNFDLDKHVKELPILPNEPVYLGLDFNVSPFTGILFVIRGKHVHYFKEVIIETVADTTMMMETAWKDSENRLTTIYPDPSGIHKHTSAVAGTTDFSLIYQAGKDLRGKKFKIVSRRRTPSLRDRWNSTNAHLKKDLITIDPSCTTLIQSWGFLTHENYKKAGEPLSHIADAATYVIENRFSIRVTVEKKRKYY